MPNKPAAPPADYTDSPGWVSGIPSRIARAYGVGLATVARWNQDVAVQLQEEVQNLRHELDVARAAADHERVDAVELRGEIRRLQAAQAVVAAEPATTPPPPPAQPPTLLETLEALLRHVEAGEGTSTPDIVREVMAKIKVDQLRRLVDLVANATPPTEKEPRLWFAVRGDAVEVNLRWRKHRLDARRKVTADDWRRLRDFVAARADAYSPPAVEVGRAVLAALDVKQDVNEDAAHHIGVVWRWTLGG